MQMIADGCGEQEAHVFAQAINTLHVEKECVCVKAAHTHTRRGGDGVRPGDVRLPVVQADENFHGPAKEKKEKEKSTTPPQHRCYCDISGLVAPQGWLFNPELHTGVKEEASTPANGCSPNNEGPALLQHQDLRGR